ncbi:MAG: type III pantothenate kinase, partial [Nitrospirae bacterium]|nr:type III pantothenate kinase [Nitrospirota bacterium]
IDFGTATTITVVDREAACIGGAIMPGVGLMNEMLEKGTSKLRRVLLEPPQTALGKDTSGSILSGLFYGCAGAVERILSEIEKETGLSLHVVVTGGYGGLMAKYIMRSYDSQPLLILRGLKLLYEKNRHS